MIKKLLIATVALALLALLAWQWIGGTAGLVGAALPNFPDHPEPVSRLAADATGELYYASATPYDFDVIENRKN